MKLHVIGNTIVPYLATDRSGTGCMYINIDNLSTKPSSLDDSLVARLPILTGYISQTSYYSS